MIGDKQLGVARETGLRTPAAGLHGRAAGQLGYGQYFFQYDAGIIDDHVPFIDAGMPAVDVVDAQFGRMGPEFDSMGEFHHLNTDTMDKVSAIAWRWLAGPFCLRSSYWINEALAKNPAWGLKPRDNCHNDPDDQESHADQHDANDVVPLVKW